MREGKEKMWSLKRSRQEEVAEVEAEARTGR